jgi:hypothetical protein
MTSPTRSPTISQSFGHIKTPLLTHGQHFEFGYERDGTFHPFAARESSTDLWTVRYGQSHRMPLSFRAECNETARVIRRNTNLPIVVLFSGGVDSEVALRAFVESGIEVSVAILRFRDDLNVHDFAWAVSACELLKVPYRFYDLDLLEFWQTEAMKYAHETQCVSPQLLSTMWLIDQIDGYCVLGSGEHYLAKRKIPDQAITETNYLRSHWDLIEKEKIAAWYRHFLVRGRDGCPGFFQYTPELMLSWLVDPLAVELWNDRIPGKLDSTSSKLRFYRQHFDLRVRPKYSGFEKVSDRDLEIRKHLYDLFPDSDWGFSTPVLKLLKDLSPQPETYPPKQLISPVYSALQTLDEPFSYRFQLLRPF